MKVNNSNEAWAMVDKLFPTDYELDAEAGKRAGYPIYKSTVPGNYSWISDLKSRIELNIWTDDFLKTTTIWIDEEPELGMTATARSFTNDFKPYQIKNIVSVQYIANTLVLTYIKDGNVVTGTYSSNDVVVEIR